MTDTAPAAMPSKMLPGTPDVLIDFPTRHDLLLFNEAVNLCHGLGKEFTIESPGLLRCLHIVYDVAAATFPTLHQLEYAEEFSMWYAKGVQSPLAAARTACRRDTGEGYRFKVRHVWLRMSVANRGDANIVVENGNPNGRGGSFKATIVVPEGEATSYDVDVDMAKEVRPARVTPQWAEAWREFVGTVLC